MNRVYVMVTIIACMSIFMACKDSSSGPTPPDLTILSPKPGDIFHFGDTIVVRWETAPQIVNTIDIMVDLMVEGTYRPITNSAIPALEGIYKWEVPDAILLLDGYASTASESTYIQLSNYQGSEKAIVGPIKIREPQ